MLVPEQTSRYHWSFLDLHQSPALNEMQGVAALGTSRHLIIFRHVEIKIFFSTKFGPERLSYSCEMTVVKFLKEPSLVSDFKLKNTVRRFSLKSQSFVCCKTNVMLYRPLSGKGVCIWLKFLICLLLETSFPYSTWYQVPCWS